MIGIVATLIRLRKIIQSIVEAVAVGLIILLTEARRFTQHASMLR